MIDFQYNGIRYALNFENPLCQKYAEDGIKTFELRVYYSLKPDSLYGSSLKQIKDNKIVWHDWDNTYLSKEAQNYCDRIFKNKTFL